MATKKAKKTKRATRNARIARNTVVLGAAVAGAADAIEPLAPNERLCVLAALVELFDAGYLDRRKDR